MFCTQCGASVPENARFFPACGQAVTPAQPQPAKKAPASSAPKAPAHKAPAPASTAAAPEGAYMLTIFRKEQWFLIDMAIRVTVDNKASYTLQKSGRVELPLAPGQHHLVFSCSFRTTVHDIYLNGNAVIELHFNRATGHIDVKDLPVAK